MKLSVAFALASLLLPAASINRSKTVGNPSAPLTIELFSDFQCPACRALHMDTLPALMRDYVVRGRAYLVYKEFPLPMHVHSKEAAAYACAAARVGRYEPVADALFRNQPAWAADGKVFETVASALTPADQKKVQDLAKDPTILNEVQQDVREGQLERFNQIPTMIIIHAGKKYPISGTLNYNLLRGLLDSLIK